MREEKENKYGHFTYHDQIKRLTEIGVALSGEKNIDRLLDMESMAKDKHIDADLYELFIKEKIYRDYAKRELAPQQIDI